MAGMAKAGKEGFIQNVHYGKKIMSTSETWLLKINCAKK
jgi:hypothetical protein